ncbi:MAG TPA: aldo/keto reductase [Candidatus Dormibacteraeota bacterium]|nr:aldo/keto reductase [Candidatus Dormibacteraeota bacterium]
MSGTELHGATKEATARYAAKFPKATKGHFRDAHRLNMSSLGMGTYLGQPDPKTDESYTAAALTAAESGINVFDAAINYRFQRSERSLGAALKQLATKGYTRDEFVLCTKGGFLTPDGAMPADANDYFFREYIQPGVFTAKDLVGGGHCMTPKFLRNQIGRSLKNLGVSCIDIYYLHNPETQLSEVSKEVFLERVRAAFEFLESAVEAGEISYYGMATWNGFREDATASGAMQLAEIAQIAQEIAGGRHHFRFVQLPFNLGMTEALTLGNQSINKTKRTVMEAANDLDISLIASASLLQGQVAKNLPPFVAEALGLDNDVERALQFVRSSPGITTALVGMSKSTHVQTNAKLVSIPPATEEQFTHLFSHGNSA